ncbi:ABC transporter permease [Desulforamulus ferrireducens]|uniref:ABC transporter n=1 Tax=Desulforamulus ferrireducens TaxID=1833852 RepID=A0A1S6J0U1_9FIRM|nr:ABC transporter permease [Desulforamulus ferrireducens]AQS60642.1 ABC transporter [Desulforamulus ferrireducens]
MFKAVLVRELTYLWRDRGLRNILLWAPLLGVLIFYATYSAQTLMAIPTAVVDLDRSSASRDLVTKVDQAENLQIVARPASAQEAEEMIRRGEVLVTVVIPENFGRQVALGRETNVYIGIDGSNIIYSTNATTAAMTVAKTVGAEAGVKALMARGLSQEQAKNAYLGVEMREEPWFNPTLNYAYFLVLALILNVWQQCCTMAATMTIIGDTGRPSWLQFKLAGISKGTLFVSKSLVHIGLYMLLALPLYGICFGILKLPMHGSWLLLLLFTLAFVIALHSVGTLASSFARSPVDATRFGMIIALPSFILSGFGWPLEAMPAFVQSLAKLLPQTWFFQGINYFTFKDPGWSFALPYFAALGVIAVVCYSAAAVFTSRK